MSVGLRPDDLHLVLLPILSLRHQPIDCDTGATGVQLRTVPHLAATDCEKAKYCRGKVESQYAPRCNKALMPSVAPVLHESADRIETVRSSITFHQKGKRSPREPQQVLDATDLRIERLGNQIPREEGR
jgi:hypothetical protein